MGLYDGPCPNLLRGDRVLIFVPSDCHSEFPQPSVLRSLPGGRSTACLFGCHYIYFWYIIFLTYNVCVSIFMTAWSGCWFIVYIRRFIYILLMFVFLIARLSQGVESVPVNHTSWVAEVIPTDRPKYNRTFSWRCLCCHLTLLTIMFV